MFIQGRENLNRAVNEDIVAVEILPERQWTCPSSLVIEDAGEKPDDDPGSEVFGVFKTKLYLINSFFCLVANIIFIHLQTSLVNVLINICISILCRMLW